MVAKKKIKILNSQIGYDLAAQNYDKKQKYLNSFEDGKILDMLGDVKDKNILDVGAGTGRITAGLVKSGASVFALDISENMLEVLKKKMPGCHSRESGNPGSGEYETVVGDAENLPFENKSFDIVVGAFLIVHLKNPSIFFDEAYRVLKPNGIFLVSNINQKEPPEVETQRGPIKIESYYHRPEEIKEKLEELAFQVEEKFISTSEVWVNQLLKCIK